MGFDDNVRDDSVTVGTTSVEVSPARRPRQRQALVITNVSTGGQIVYLMWADEAIAGKGIPLFPGGAWSESVDSAYTPPKGKISAIASGALGSIAIHEQMEG